jgi:hypothetical protein
MDFVNQFSFAPQKGNVFQISGKSLGKHQHGFSTIFAIIITQVHSYSAIAGLQKALHYLCYWNTK